jgi:hypothetical protein
VAANEGRGTDEDRDSVAPQPERVDPADAGGDSPGPDIGAPDELAASDRPGTTVEEQLEPAMERRLAMERPDVWETGLSGESAEPPKPIVDDDVATEDLNVEEPRFDADEADMDRTRQEAAEQSVDEADEGPEGAAMHIEPER